jgi:hypothetical protein
MDVRVQDPAIQGSDYIGDMTRIGNVRLNIEGSVAIFVDGSINSIGKERFHVAHGSSLDLYVAGSVTSVGDVGYGNPRVSARRPPCSRSPPDGPMLEHPVVRPHRQHAEQVPQVAFRVDAMQLARGHERHEGTRPFGRLVAPNEEPVGAADDQGA